MGPGGRGGDASSQLLSAGLATGYVNYCGNYLKNPQQPTAVGTLNGTTSWWEQQNGP